MKKSVTFYLLRLVSLFLFFVLTVSVIGLIKILYYNKEGLALAFTYGLGGTMILIAFFWLNTRLWKYSSQMDK